MNISDAQRDVRTVFLGGFAGQLVASALWFLSAALGNWYSTRSAILFLFFGGMFIFPLTQLFLRLMGGPSGLPKGHPMNALGMQVAFVLPLCLPLVAATTAYRPNWFYPAFMVALGAHYLPFIFLYGMWQFGVLGGLLIGAGLAFGLYLPTQFSVGGWFTALALLVFAFIGKSVAMRDRKRPG